MFNVGGGELLVILLVALIVLGPTKLPDAARQFGRVMTEIRRFSSGFQREMRDALDEPVEAAARERGGKITRSTAAVAGMYRTPEDEPAPEDGDGSGDSVTPADGPASGGEPTPEDEAAVADAADPEGQVSNADDEQAGPAAAAS